jgi:hypothetical protein
VIKVVCDLHEGELDEPGAVVFSPPDSNGWCKKLHLCKSCYELLFVGPFRGGEPDARMMSTDTEFVITENWVFREAVQHVAETIAQATAKHYKFVPNPVMEVDRVLAVALLEAYDMKPRGTTLPRWRREIEDTPAV